MWIQVEIKINESAKLATPILVIIKDFIDFNTVHYTETLLVYTLLVIVQ